MDSASTSSGASAERRSPEQRCRWQRLAAEYVLLHEVRQWEPLMRSGTVPIWMLSIGRSCEQQLLDREHSLVAAGHAYALIRQLYGGEAVKQLTPSCIAYRSAREASKLMRDVLVWRCFSNGGASSEEAYRRTMDIAFEGAFLEDEDLVSKMMLPWSIAQGQGILASAGQKKKKSRKKKPSTAKRTNVCTKGNWADVFSTSPPCPQLFGYDWTWVTEAAFNSTVDSAADGFGDDNVSIPDTDITAMMPRDWIKRFSTHEAPQDEAPQKAEDACSEGFAPTEESYLYKYKEPVDPPLEGPFRPAKAASQKTASKRPVLPSIADEALHEEEPVESKPVWTCKDCGSQGANGWPDRDGNYYCICCWEKFQQEISAKSRGEKPAAKPDPLDTVSDGDLLEYFFRSTNAVESSKLQQTKTIEHQRYEEMEPIVRQETFDTQVQVMSVCCLSAAQLMNNGSCVVVLSPQFFPGRWDASNRKWPLGALLTRTTFRDAFQGFEVSPRWGGFYLPEVSVHSDELAGPIPPVSIPVLFASPPWKPEAEDGQRFHEEMRAKVANLLRICQSYGHQELLISATFHGLPAREVAAIFREVLLESGDVARAFKRVTFALPHNEVDGKVVLSFQEEFSAQHGPRKIEDFKRIMPTHDAELCLDVPLENVTLQSIQGTVVQLAKPQFSAGREHQHWLLLPCGRIVLAAYPQLCLSASTARDGAHVHIWTRVERNEHLQTWKVEDGGSIQLKDWPELKLSLSSDSCLVVSSSETAWSWTAS